MTRDDILRCLEPIWLIHNETASRLRGRIECVLGWAKAKSMREGDNPAVWKGGLQSLLPAPGKTQKVVNHPSMPYADVPKLLLQLKTIGRESAKALIFLILTTARTSEVLGSTWTELRHLDNAKDATWIIPGLRMKAGREHRVPLSTGALRLLPDQSRLGPCIFSNAVLGDKAMSNMAMAMLLRRLGYSQFTVHGFRSTFRNWAAKSICAPT